MCEIESCESLGIVGHVLSGVERACLSWWKAGETRDANDPSLS